ncbi:MAG TPA: hypothetical protein VFC94_05890 [Bacteroidaceae bacterium]|nr:hypothetical protein [Bacteroidaceae bacterium]
MIKIVEVFSKRDKKRFLKFQIDLYKDCPYYVPDLIKEEMNRFNPKNNGAYAYAESRLWLAEIDGKVVGRIGGILNKAANIKDNVRQLRFTRFDFIDDYRVSKALFDTVINWAEELGMNELIGPLGFSNLDKQGMLTEGFNELDMYITLYNYPYYINHMKKLGLIKKWDWKEMKINVPEKIPENVERMAEIVSQRYGYSIKRFKSMREVKPYLKDAMNIINLAFINLEGVVPISEKQIKSISNLIMLVGRPEYSIMVINKYEEIIGFGFFAPSISRAIQKSKGRMGPLTILRLLSNLRDHTHIDLYMVGVKPEDQMKGLFSLILKESISNLIKNGATDTETGPMLESNSKIHNVWKHFDYRYHRSRRCFHLFLPENRLNS